MSNRIEELFSELKQICDQYKAEVPSKRRAWPMSVKTRVFELRKCGLTDPQIAKRTGLCYQTMYTWKPLKEENFLPVDIIPRPPKSLTVTVSGSQKPPVKYKTKNTTMTVITPDGFKIEGMDQVTLFRLLGKS